MALVYKDFALLSVGMSCQFAHQLRHQKDWIDVAIGQISELRATPLDWQIAPPRAAAWQIDRGQFFPESTDQIETRRTVPGFPEMNIFFWRDSGSSYWHEPKMLTEVERIRSKFANTTKTWHNLRTRRVIAVFSNSQSNLASVEELNPSLRSTPSVKDLKILQDSLKRRFKKLHFHCVFSLNRIPHDIIDGTFSWSTYRAEDSSSDWRGDDSEWRRLLLEILYSDGMSSPALL